MREAFRKFRKMTTPEVIDHAITSTMSRTIITHGSTQLMVLSMLLFGGPTLHYFAVALTIGIPSASTLGLRGRLPSPCGWGQA